MIYDSTLNVTWAAEANLSRILNFGIPGVSDSSMQRGDMHWYTAQTWLEAVNNSNYLGYNDWRLPTASPVNGSAYNDQFSTNGTTDIGFNITSKNSELGHLANVDLVAIIPTCSPDSPQSPPNCTLENFGLFRNIKLSATYLTASDVYPGSDSYRAFAFYNPVTVNSVPFEWGFQGTASKNNPGAAMILRNGDVASVPELSTAGLLMAGLALVGFHRYSVKNRSRALNSRFQKTAA